MADTARSHGQYQGTHAEANQTIETDRWTVRHSSMRHEFRMSVWCGCGVCLLLPGLAFMCRPSSPCRTSTCTYSPAPSSVSVVIAASVARTRIVSHRVTACASSTRIGAAGMSTSIAHSHSHSQTSKAPTATDTTRRNHRPNRG